ncbi:MAG TPA: hypothetical protein VE820_11855, partial [Sphingomicrobium sp.]|nr:hypothetical protein [Sphingomicrobium sp.]
MRSKAWIQWAFATAAVIPAPALAQGPPSTQSTAQAPASTSPDRAAEVKELQDLQAMKRDMQSRMDQFDARIEALEQRLGAPAVGPASPAVQRPLPAATEATLEATTPDGTRPAVEQEHATEQAPPEPEQKGGPAGW